MPMRRSKKSHFSQHSQLSALKTKGASGKVDDKVRERKMMEEQVKKKSRNCSCSVALWPLTSLGKDAMPCHTHCSLIPGVGTHRQSAQAQRTGWPHRTSFLIIGISFCDLKSKNFSLSFFFSNGFSQIYRILELQENFEIFL